MREIALLFLRLGVFGFGGPIATMAMMEEEAVRKRGWLTPDEFSEIYAVCKMLPGPVSTQMAIYLGSARARSAWGGVVSGTLFVLPSFAMVLALAMVYRHSGAVARAGAYLSGLQAAALSVIVLSTWGLARPYKAQRRAWFIAAFSTVIVYLRPGWEPLVILGFGLVGAQRAQEKARRLLGPVRAKGGTRVHALGWLPSAQAAGTTAALATTKAAAASSAGWPVLGQLFWMCFKAGMFVFGTGLAVVPVLEADAVGLHGWLTHSQFMDGLAVGQVTPGPVVITSTFIGYLASGLPGALAATFGMFLPSFFNVLFLVPRVWKRFSGTAAAAGFSSFAIPAVLGGILGATLKLGSLTLVSAPTVAVFVLATAVLIWKKPPAWALIPAGGIVGGLLARALGGG